MSCIYYDVAVDGPSSPLTVTESLRPGSADSITAKSKVHSHPWPGRRVAEETLVVTSNLLSRKESHYNVSVQVQLKVKEKLTRSF